MAELKLHVYPIFQITFSDTDVIVNVSLSMLVQWINNDNGITKYIAINYSYYI